MEPMRTYLHEFPEFLCSVFLNVLDREKDFKMSVLLKSTDTISVRSSEVQ